ncbi:alanyl-tRNA synthetase [Dethiosulfatibacter aminovorans DSM 17477]|uniref:Alanine--tRNA ligase n=1 Tax=Dethiosulfatibacter aminovorans DSM 17477 TaxID=1121476 RepID=A0A1M6D645_9FIRM|nr:alanine--tRNA ligase [Dethiosulfatibacter aminovorans]SHI68621.1 alanyl-tRNA synthetase [Dethiosulfatibacter aminovorans DSM 17477]
MNKYSVDNIRKSFIEFFESKNHLAAHSFPLIPKNDNTLLLVNAGMAPLKRYFTGADTPPRTRMVTCQKCVRTGDIENVGHTSRHCTFFEMLGNFSFGDYFKKEAIAWAWEFMTEKMGLDDSRLWVSVYHEDDEAYNIWKDEIKVPEERIVRLGKEDNFWELEVGPSGPCSEIYYDRGEQYDCGDPNCMPGCDCDRYVEVWNLVFTQFNKDEKGEYHPLANPNIDTGMGLERMAAVLQGKENVFEIEPLVSIIKMVEKISGVEYGKDKKTDISVRIITDHARAVTFLIGDGVIPSNEGRGYVLRRLLRRAARHGKLLGIRDNFMTTISKLVVEMFGEAYPELANSADQIYKIIEIEEDRFSKTIDQGIEILNTYTEKMEKDGTTELSGEQAFKLYDTYGFPFELTEEILGEKGLTVSEESFVEFMNKQKENARKARNASAGEAWHGSSFKIENTESTLFKGYTEKETEATILKLYDEEYNEVQSIDGKGFAVTDETVLYAESGGQKGDCGIMAGEGVSAHVEDVTKANNDIFLHHVKVTAGTLKTGDKVKVTYDIRGRNATAANHTATHLLHEALRQVLGSHVNQSGSLVEKERLRFDFSHFEGMTDKEIEEVEKMVNEKIFENLQVTTASMTLEEAKASGITALFDSKYGEKVRVISVEGYSRELCGGTHVKNTSEIGLFKIVSETGIASGIRRIEALTGMDAFDYLNAYRENTLKLASKLKTKPENIENRINQILAESKEKDAVIQNYKSEAVKAELGNILDNYTEEGNVKIFLNNLGESDADQMRELSDRIKDKYSDSVAVLAAESNGKVLLIASVAKPLVKEGLHAGNIIREAAKVVGGGGGGRPDFAQAGGKKPEKIDEALNKALEIIKDMIK